MSSIFSNHSGMARNQLQEECWKFYKYVEIKNMLLNNQWVKKEMEAK